MEQRRKDRGRLVEKCLLPSPLLASDSLSATFSYTHRRMLIHTGTG